MQCLCDLVLCVVCSDVDLVMFVVICVFECEVCYVYVQLLQLMYECVISDGDCYVSDSNEGNLCWVLVWIGVYLFYLFGWLGLCLLGGGWLLLCLLLLVVLMDSGLVILSGGLVLILGQGLYVGGCLVFGGGSLQWEGNGYLWFGYGGLEMLVGNVLVCDVCYLLFQQDVCFCFNDWCWELQWCYNSVLQSECDVINCEQCSIDVWLDCDCN